MSEQIPLFDPNALKAVADAVEAVRTGSTMPGTTSKWGEAMTRQDEPPTTVALRAPKLHAKYAGIIESHKAHIKSLRLVVRGVLRQLYQSDFIDMYDKAQASIAAPLYALERETPYTKPVDLKAELTKLQDFLHSKPELQTAANELDAALAQANDTRKFWYNVSQHSKRFTNNFGLR